MLRRNIIKFPSNWQHIINIHVLPLSPAQTHMNAYELLQSHSVLQKKILIICVTALFQLHRTCQNTELNVSFTHSDCS